MFTPPSTNLNWITLAMEFRLFIYLFLVECDVLLSSLFINLDFIK